MDHKLLKTFITVANHSSFTSAAKELYIAQSAVSKHINQLERELGVQLFLRDTRMVRLTTVGEAFYKDSVDILDRMDAAVANLYHTTDMRGGSLTMGTFSVLSGEVVDLVRAFQRHDPNTAVSLNWYEFSDLICRVEDGTLDVGFTIGFEIIGKSQLKCKTIEKGRIYVLLGRQHPLAAAKELRLRDLAELTYFTMKPVVTPNGYLSIMRYFAEREFQPKATCTHPSHESMLLQIQIHNAYSLMGDFQYRNHPGISFVPLVEEEQPTDSTFDMVAVWHAKNENPCIAQLLREFE